MNAGDLGAAWHLDENGRDVHRSTNRFLQNRANFVQGFYHQ